MRLRGSPRKEIASVREGVPLRDIPCRNSNRHLAEPRLLREFLAAPRFTFWMHAICFFLFSPGLFPIDAPWNAAIPFIHQGTTRSVQTDSKNSIALHLKEIHVQRTA